MTDTPVVQYRHWSVQVDGPAATVTLRRHGIGRKGDHDLDRVQGVRRP